MKFLFEYALVTITYSLNTWLDLYQKMSHFQNTKCIPGSLYQIMSHSLYQITINRAIHILFN